MCLNEWKRFALHLFCFGNGITFSERSKPYEPVKCDTNEHAKTSPMILSQSFLVMYVCSLGRLFVGRGMYDVSCGHVSSWSPLVNAQQLEGAI